MFRIMLGVAAVLALTSLTLFWRLSATASERDAAVAQVGALQDTVKRQTTLTEALRGSLAALDASMQELHQASRRNNQQLARKIAGLETITKTKGDTDESIDCMPQPVPRQLDQWLRTGD